MAYILKTTTDFAAAHFLRGYNGACANLHGHNWKVEVEVIADELDDIGIALDFKTLKNLSNEICVLLDHSCLNEIEYFSGVNPTAENVAHFFYLAMEKKLKNYPARIHAVTIWETERACAKYFQTEAK